MNIQKTLFELQDKKYGDFQANLTPTMKRESIIGVRVPALRNLAKEVKKQPVCDEFLQTLPHDYYDENMLHSILLSEEKDYDKAIQYVEAFLPYVDNWAVCDTLSPKVFKKHRQELIIKAQQWSKSQETYTCRFGLKMIMTHYLDEDFRPEYLEYPASIISDEYYVKMMVAWLFATALAKQWDATIPYIQENRMEKWIHNKTIQKAVESYRITPEQKEYLKGLRIK